MPPTKKKAPSASASKGLKAKDKACPYNKSVRSGPVAVNKKPHAAHSSKTIQARTNHHNVNLTSELDSLLGDLNNQLQRGKTKRDARLGVNKLSLPLQLFQVTILTFYADPLTFDSVRLLG